MQWFSPRVQVAIAVAAMVGSATLLHASCVLDECTMTVYRAPPQRDWCSEYEEGNGILLRSSTPTGGVQDQYPDPTQQRDRQYCSSCQCSSEVAMVLCANASGWFGGWTSCNKFACVPGS